MTQRSRPPAVLILAGLDPSGGAGLFADAEAVREMGARPLLVPTALTVQTTKRARSFQPVEAEQLLAMARALLDEEAEEDVRAVKIGMLASPSIARAIRELITADSVSRLPIVLDPVIAASSGASLFAGTAAEARAAIESIWDRALITPNALEAQSLLGLADPPRDADALDSAGRALLAKGAKAALVKGGHAIGREAIDVLVERASSSPRADHDSLVASRLSDPRIEPNVKGGRSASKIARGTGCRLASAMAAQLAFGRSNLEAARAAKSLVAHYLVRENG